MVKISKTEKIMEFKLRKNIQVFILKYLTVVTYLQNYYLWRNFEVFQINILLYFMLALNFNIIKAAL